MTIFPVKIQKTKIGLKQINFFINVELGYIVYKFNFSQLQNYFSILLLPAPTVYKIIKWAVSDQMAMYCRLPQAL